jgi:hypothetical protein
MSMAAQIISNRVRGKRGCNRETLEVATLRITAEGRASEASGRFMRLLGSIRDDPEHWRERAEEARHVAGQMSDPVAA